MLIIVLALALHFFLTNRMLGERVEGAGVEGLERVARHLVADLDRTARPADWSAVAQRLARGTGGRVTLIDRSGRVLGDSGVDQERLHLLDNHATRPEVRAALEGRPGHATRRSATVREKLLYVAVPVGAGDVAVLRIAEPLGSMEQMNASLIGTTLLIAALVSLVIIVGVGVVTGRVALRIEELKRAAERMAAGDPVRAPERPADELGSLGRALNHLSAETASRLETIAGERDRREQLLAHMRDGVALVDGMGRLVHANHSLAEILGLPRPAEAGTPFPEFARHPEIEALITGARARGGTVERDMRIWEPRDRLVRGVATPLDDADGSVLLVVHDLSEAARVDRVRADFVANVSHELRTPLTSLRGYAETLLEGGFEDVKNREWMTRTIVDQSRRMSALVDDLLSLAELERPGVELRRSDFDLRDAVAAQLAAFRERATRSGLTLELAPGPAVRVQADRARIDQVIANLLDNAVKYTEAGSVEARVSQDAGWNTLEVEDTGPGIPEPDRARVFERFYRVDKARARELGGTGLGLAIVKHIAGLHHGEVTVREGRTGGSAFVFEWPQAASHRRA